MTAPAAKSWIGRIVLLLAWAVLSVTSPGNLSAEGPALTDARIGLNSGQTRFVLEFSQNVPYKIFTLAGPDRVVIDLPSVAWKGPETGQISERGLIRGYRHGLFKPGITRVVIDLAGPASVFRHFQLGASGNAGPRIVIDLAPAPVTIQSTEPETSDDWAAYSEELERTAPSFTTAVPPADSGRRVVVLDPGHGGVDPGAIGASGIYEKKVVLAFGKILADALTATGRYDVVMTRDRDIFIPLRERYEVAHSVNAGLFVSIHADSHNNAALRGLSVYTLSEKASDKEAEALAAKENLSDVLAGTDLTGYEADVTSILISLAQTSVKQSSSTFAELLVEQMTTNSVQLLRNPHRFAGFAVLKSPNVPSVLVELGFLSNRSDEANLMSNALRQQMANSMVQAIDRYFDQKEAAERS